MKKIKSVHFETLFSMIFFLVPVWFYTKTPGKNPFTEENVMETKVRFMKTSKSWPHFSLGLKFLWSYFLRLYWQPPYYFRKKVPGILNSGLYFQWNFVIGLQKIGTFIPKFLFPVFSETFFPVKLSYINS